MRPYILPYQYVGASFAGPLMSQFIKDHIIVDKKLNGQSISEGLLDLIKNLEEVIIYNVKELAG